MPNPLHVEDPRAERLALWAGLLLAAASLAGLGLVAVDDPSLARALVAQWLSHTALGKETSVPMGLSLGVPPTLVALASFAQDAVVLLVGYPMVLLASRGALRWDWLRRLVDRPHPRHTAFALRTEAPGVALLAFTLWIPFLPSGGLVAALLARTAGYRPRVFLPAIVASALAASIAYTVVYVRVAQLLGPHALWALVAAGAGVALALALVNHLRERRKRAARPSPMRGTP